MISLSVATKSGAFTFRLSPAASRQRTILSQIDDVDPIGLLLEDVLLHGGLSFVGSDVGGGGQYIPDVILGDHESVKVKTFFFPCGGEYSKRS